MSLLPFPQRQPQHAVLIWVPVNDPLTEAVIEVACYDDVDQALVLADRLGNIGVAALVFDRPRPQRRRPKR